MISYYLFKMREPSRKLFVLLVFIITSAKLFGQDTLYYPKIEIYEKTFTGDQSAGDIGNYNNTNTKIVKKWFFSAPGYGEQKVHPYGDNLRPIMKGCNDCNMHLDKLKAIHKRGGKRVLMGLCCMIIAPATIIPGAKLYYEGIKPSIDHSTNQPYDSEKSISAKKRSGMVLIGVGAISTVCVIPFFVSSARQHKKHWPAQLKNTITAYNNYRTTLDN